MTPPDRDPLRELLEAAGENDDTALAELVRRTQPVVWRLCQALGSPHDTDDLVQETYLRALRSLSTFRGESPVQAWLLAIARNVCVDHVRRRQRHRRLVERLIGATAVAAAGGGQSTFDHHGDVAELLAVLDDDRREAFVLTQVVGLSYEDAAIAAGCPVGTIRSRVSRARRDLLAAVRSADAR